MEAPEGHWAIIHARYDWTTGVPDNGNEWRKFRAVPRLYPLRSLFVHCLTRVEAEGLLDYQGRAGIISIVRWNLRPVIFGVGIRQIQVNFQRKFSSLDLPKSLAFPWPKSGRIGQS